MSLTRFKSGITILTEDFINTLYGGLYGDPEGDALDPSNPLVGGHVHDGSRGEDGHAQKIDLGEHVTGRLDGSDILDNSITPDKLTSFTFDSVWSTALNVTSNAPGTLASDSFLFGSSTLSDAGDATHDSRMLFEKSTGAFRAGTANSTQWDTRGLGSAAFGTNTQANGNYTFVVGQSNAIEVNSVNSSICGGGSNAISSTAIYSCITSGLNNSIVSANYSSVCSGQGNSITGNGDCNAILGGISNEITTTSNYNSILGGTTNSITSSGNCGIIVGGHSNVISGSATACAAIAGTGNVVTTDYSTIVGADGQTIMLNQHSISGGTFPGDSSGRLGQTQLNDLVVFGSYAISDTSCLLTLDGNAPSTDNILYVPTNSSTLITIEWNILLSDMSFFGGGTAISIIGRQTLAAAAGDIGYNQYQIVGTGSDRVFVGSTGSSGVAANDYLTWTIVGVGGGFYLSVDFTEIFGGASSGAGRCNARIKMTQLRA
jgi:hypothetical protein